jgi:hypothetical protein
MKPSSVFVSHSCFSLAAKDRFSGGEALIAGRRGGEKKKEKRKKKKKGKRKKRERIPQHRWSVWNTTDLRP